MSQKATIKAQIEALVKANTTSFNETIRQQERLRGFRRQVEWATDKIKCSETNIEHLKELYEDRIDEITELRYKLINLK